jgi:bacteriorhodopsin
MNFLFVILSVRNFLTTLGVIVLIYYALKFVGRLLFPIVVKKAVNNMQERQTQYQRQYQQQKPEGQVTVEKNQPQQSRNNSAEGEYVDFEEIE